MEVINRPHVMANLYSYLFPYNYVISYPSTSGLGHLPCLAKEMWAKA